ncbi:uncharacterized protein LOC141653723 [Silene latifolia]|uniref:uncharacterized protein LOC141653723 n=1 Tax=Silene latifolia TaxID=37657 RepID=UPI003D77404F
MGVPCHLPSNLGLRLRPQSSPIHTPLLTASPRSSNSIRWSTVKCSTNPEQQEAGGLKKALSKIVDDRVEELLLKDENKELLDKLNKASERVELAREELANIQRQEIEALQMRDYVDQLETRASQIAECQKEVLEARKILEQAEDSLESNVDALQTEERLESVKAALISGLVGTLAAVPIYLSQLDVSPQLLLQLGISFASCALFGVTFRYAVRRDLDNIQLKTGTAAAFAFVKGLATLGAASPLELNSESLLSHAIDAAVFVSQDLLIFVFAAVSLDFCFKTRVISPFPIKPPQ